MKADTHTLKRLFQRDIRYVIPTFQRPYVWNQEDQWEPLWDDVRNTAERYLENLAATDGNEALAEEQTPSHFMGAVVLQQQPTAATAVEVRHVVDGQQRLTTAQLLMDAAQAAFAGLDLQGPATRMSRLVENAYSDGDERYKLWPTGIDRPAFVAAMANDINSANHAQSSIVQAHEFFRLQISEWLLAADGEDEQARRATALETALLGLLELVVIDLASVDDAFVIFETLNARGTPLIQSDLIKNYVLQTAAESGLNSDGVYETEWRPLDDEWWRAEAGQGRIRRPRLDLFLNYWLVMEWREDVPPASLFHSFRKHVEQSRKPVVAVAQELRHVASVYRGFESVDPYSDFGTFLYRWRIIDAGTTTPLLLWLWSQSEDVVSAADRMRSISAVESFLVRRMLCRMTTKDYNNLFLELLKRVAVSAPGEAAEIVVAYLSEQTAESRMWPDDDIFTQSLLDLPLYRLLTRGRLRMVLESLEDKLRSPLVEETHCPRRTLTIEHVMPQAWRAAWDKPEGGDELIATLDRDRLLHTLGNLTLVSGRLNPTLSNGRWEEKRAALADHTVLHLNRSLLRDFSESPWDEQVIRERGKALAAEVVKLWPSSTTMQSS